MAFISVLTTVVSLHRFFFFLFNTKPKPSLKWDFFTALAKKSLSSEAEAALSSCVK